MKRRNDKRILRVVVSTGIASIVTQLLLIREFISQFKGNEYVIALILFSWLMLGAMGTLAARTGSNRIPASRRLLAWLSILLAIFGVWQILLVRLLRDFLFLPGVSIGFYPTFFFIFMVMTPYALMVGFLLPYSLYTARMDLPAYPGAKIYIADNAGDVAGGALFSFLLVYLATPLQAAALSGLLLAAAAFSLLTEDPQNKRFVIAAACVTAGLMLAGLLLEPYSLASFQGRPVHYEESRYGRITLHRDQEQITLFADGTPLFSNQNRVAAEESVHYPMAQIENPEAVLLISAESGMLREIRKHRPALVDYVELDPRISALLFQYGFLERIPGLNVIHADGRAWLRKTHKKYDAVIVNLPEPETFQINRFYTDRFFEMVKARLKTGGVFSFAMSGYDNYLAEPQRQKISSLYNTVKACFRNVMLLPGEKVYFLCSDDPLDTDIPACLKRRGIKTDYVAYYYYGNITASRIEDLRELIDPEARSNSDIAPRLMRIMYDQWFEAFQTSPKWFYIAAGIVLLIFLVRFTAAEMVLFSTGFTVMGSELLVIFAFQMFLGFIYHQIGLIVTVFLAGLLPGAWIGERLRYTEKAVLVFTDSMLILFTGIFIIAVTHPGPHIRPASFLCLGFVMAFVCGCQFPQVLRMAGDDNPAAARAFSADLVGAAFGGLIVSVVLIPYTGIVYAAWGLIGLKCISLAVIGGHRENRYKA